MHPHRPACSIVAPLVLALLLAAAACGPFDQDPPGEDERRAAGLRNLEEIAASERNYDIYWLGPGFTAGGIEYWGPDIDDPDSETAEIGKVEGGGVEMYYLPSETTCCGSLTLVLYSRPAWERIQQRRAAGAPERAEVSEVDINGRTAELRTSSGSVKPVSGHVLVIDLGSTVVEAVTLARVPPTPGAAQPNPLIDEATFLAVMQNLRPYPE